MELFAAVIILVFAGLLVRNIAQFIQNENSPVVTEQALVTRKINDTHIDANGVASTTLLICFDVGGQVLKCSVPGRVYRAIPKGASGLLTHQGTRFKAFEFGGCRVEK